MNYPLGETHQVHLAGTVVSRITLQPGWNWQEHAQPLIGTESCELYHRGVVVIGRLGVRTDSGEESVIPPNHVFDIRPGHVIWVEGNDELVMLDWAGGAGFGVTPGTGLPATATILITDIVESTRRAQQEGDATWRHTIGIHDDVVRSVLADFGGREMNTAGDSFLPLFDSAERAIRCGLALSDALAGIDISIRVGVHTGEVIVLDEQVRGLAVHVAARILAEADSGEVLTSRITRDLAEDSRGLAFDARGSYRLQGVEGEHELFAVSAADSAS